MNLADAIRQAAKGVPEAGSTASAAASTPAPEPTPRFEVPVEPAPVTAPRPEARTQTGAEEPPVAVDAVTHAPVALPDAPSAAVRSGQVIRLELFLPPEQLSQLFRAVMTSQHSMLTLRETAQYLRVAPQVVEQMARDGDVPAVMIDGRWRFPKNSLDEWLTLRSFRKPSEDQDAA